MNNKRHILQQKKQKQGNIFIPIGLVVLVILFATIFLVYYQLNVIIENVRKDLFYASNNAILSFDTQDLAYKKYTIDKNKTKQVIENILNKNYTEIEGSVTKIEIIDLDIVQKENKVYLSINVKVTFKSVINLAGENEHEFKMNENIKISLLDY